MPALLVEDIIIVHEGIIDFERSQPGAGTAIIPGTFSRRDSMFDQPIG